MLLANQLAASSSKSVWPQDTGWFQSLLFYFCFAHRFYLLVSSFSFSLSRRNSDPGSLSRLSPPLPTTVRAFVLIAGRSRLFLSLSTRIGWCLPVLCYCVVGALRSSFGYFPCFLLFIFLRINSTARCQVISGARVSFEPQSQLY